MAAINEPYLTYDEQLLLHRLRNLTPTSRALFAALCAERLIPLHQETCRRLGKYDEAATLREVLQGLWDAMIAGDLQHFTRVPNLPVSEEPHEAPDWMELALAENAASAVAYAIDCGAEGAAQPAAWAARQGYEAMDLVASNMLDIDYDDATAEARLASHPLVQRELRFQERDLRAVEVSTATLTGSQVLDMKMRAKRAAYRLDDILPNSGQ